MPRKRLSSHILAYVGLLHAAPALAQNDADPGEIERRIEQLRPAPAPAPRPGISVPRPVPRVDTGAEISFVLTAVAIEGASVFEAAELGRSYADFLARTVGPAELEEIARRVTKQYAEAGYFLSRAVVPPQEVQDGVLRLRVVEGYIAEVQFQGGEAQESLLDRHRAVLARERPARLGTVERALLVINAVPGIGVGDIQAAALDDDGAHELILTLTYEPVSGSANLDNRGTPSVGPAQAWVGVSLNSIFGIGEQIQLALATVPNETEELEYRQISYRQPLGADGLTLGASLARGDIDAGSELAIQETESRSTTAEFDLRYPLLLSRRQAMNLQGSIEIRDVSEDRFAISTLDDRLRVLRAQADYALQDDLGGTSLLVLELSQGLDILSASRSGDPNLSRFDGDGSFTKIELDLVRVQDIWGPVSLRLAGRGQLAFDPLLSSEEYLLGGSQFGRAYDFGEISGEHGVAGSAELRFARPLKDALLRRYEVYGFYDGGSVWDYRVGASHRRQSLTSAGAGLRLELTRNIQSSVEVAKPLNRTVTTTGERDARVFLSLSAQF